MAPLLPVDRQRLVDELIRDEGLRLFPYTDSVGKLSVGVGRNLTDKGLSHAEAMLLLDHDLDEAILDLATFPWFVGLDDVRQRVLVNLRFQLGAAGFRRFRRMLAALAAGEFPVAAAQMRASRWATQVPTRAARLATMMETGR